MAVEVLQSQTILREQEPLACNWKSWSRCLVELLFPAEISLEAAPQKVVRPYCERCGEPAIGAIPAVVTYNCTDCQHHWGYFQRARSGYLAKGQVLEAVINFKYHEQFYHRPQLVQWLVESFDRYFNRTDYDGIVPVPLHPRRKRARGFNQAKELALGLSRARQMPVRDVLYRYRETESQTRLSRAQRMENLDDAIALKRRFDVSGLNLLLVDDVFTTGSTAEACARVLAAAGAKRLDVLTIARS